MYLLYTSEEPQESNNTDIQVRHSDDQGDTWSAPVKVNDDAGTNSQFNFNAGNLGSKSTTISNNQTFAVGDGIDAATFQLLGGIHTFSSGLRVRSSAAVTGCGTSVTATAP